MFKKHKTEIILSSIIILLPILFGMVMWKELPDIMATHWNATGTADGFSGKAFAVFGVPVILLCIHLFCLLVTSFDQKQKEQTPKALIMIFWIFPMVSLFVSVIMYSAAFEKDINIELFIPLLLGVLFVFIGNYLPKVKQNRTLGIKLSWTLRNSENWNKTHRFGGKIWVGCGFLMLLSASLPIEISLIVLLTVIALGVIAPTVYSYRIYKKHQKEGIEYADMPQSKEEKLFAGIGTVAVVIILISIAVLMFTGSIETKCTDTTLDIHATYWNDLEVNYTEMDTVTYRKDLDIGTRTNGFNSAKLLLGSFKNEEFGRYTLYAYTDAKEFIVLTSGEKTLVIGMRDSKDTEEIYNTISEKIGGKQAAGIH